MTADAESSSPFSVVVPPDGTPNGRPTGQRGLLLHVRTGSDVVVPNAFRVLSVPTTA